MCLIAEDSFPAADKLQASSMTEQVLIIVTAGAGKAGCSRKSWLFSRGVLSLKVMLEQFIALLMKNLIS